jgi:cell division protein FtsW
MNQSAKYDPILLAVVLCLTGFGLVMVYSASAVFARDQTQDALFFFKRQLVHVALGLAALWVGTKLGYRRLTSLAYPLLSITVVLLVLVLIPGLGTTAGGSARWLRLGWVSIQPGELAKVTVVIYLAYSLTRKQEKIKAFSIGCLPHLMICGVLVLLLLVQPDFGTSATLTLILFLMLFVAGTRVSYIAATALASLPMAYLLIVGSPYRLQRFTAFLDPWSHRYNIGYQIAESLMSFGSGGILGVGLGESKHKLFFLPAAHTDFIYSIIGEELGLLGALTILALYGVLVWRGLRAAARAPDVFGTLLAFGFSLLIGLQTLVNIGVVTGMLPTKGLTLPLLSYGGSSIICMMFALGILLDISAHGTVEQSARDPKVTWPCFNE